MTDSTKQHAEPQPSVPRRARILQLSYACSPAKGSEPGVGWNRAVQAARFSDVWVICEGNEFADVIRQHLASHPVPGLHFEFLPKTPLEQELSRLPGLYYLGYNLWHRRAFKLAQRLHRRLPFDLVHQVNMCGFREPGYLWKLDTPFLWGPVGGTQIYPWRFLTQADWLGGCGEILRSLSNELQLRFSTRVRRAARRSAVVLTATSTNQRDFARTRIAQSVRLLETGLASTTSNPAQLRDPDAALKILWVGEFRTWKALPLLLRALGSCSRLNFHLRIVGAGPLEKKWRHEAKRQGIAERCEWLGWLPRSEVPAQYNWSDVLCFTSLRDTSGNVVLEAMAAGVPVVCLDHQGGRDLVTEESGLKIPVWAPGQVIGELRQALLELAADPRRHQELRAGAARRGEQLLWTQQGERMRQIYQDVLGDGYCWRERERHDINPVSETQTAAPPCRTGPLMAATPGESLEILS